MLIYNTQAKNVFPVYSAVPFYVYLLHFEWTVDKTWRKQFYLNDYSMELKWPNYKLGESVPNLNSELWK